MVHKYYIRDIKQLLLFPKACDYMQQKQEIVTRYGLVSFIV